VVSALAHDAEQFTLGEVTPQPEEAVVRGGVAESGVEATDGVQVGGCRSIDLDGLPVHQSRAAVCVLGRPEQLVHSILC
jgi:hypothetical protein